MALPAATAPLVLLLLLVAAGGASGAGGSPGDAGFSFGTMIGCAPPAPTPEASASAQAEAAASFRAGLAQLLAALPSAAAATGFATLPSASAGAGRGSARALGVCFGPAAPSESGCEECLRAAVAAAFEGCADDARGAGAWRPGCAVSYADGDGASLANEGGDARPRFPAGGMDSSYLDTLEQRLADLAKALAQPKRRPLWKIALSVLFYVLATIGAVAVVFLLCAFVAGCLFAESLFQIMDAAGRQLGENLDVFLKVLTARKTTTIMESGEIRTRFGRCPYCRAMIYRDPEAVIYYCSKCRTPIRGKNTEQTEEIDHALSRLEILSADTASVFSDELDACPTQASAADVHGEQPPFFGNSMSCSSLTASSPDDQRVYSNARDGLRPSSRRTRRSACSDSFVLRYGVFMSTHSETEEGVFSSPRNACERQRRRSLVGLPELETSVGWSRPAPSPPPPPLTDPAFHRDLLGALDDLRGLIAAIEPASTGASAAAARRGARFFRRMQSHLSQALPPQELAPRRGAGGSTGSSRSSSASASSAGGRSERRKRHHCRPVFGGAPFLVCGGCSELLQVPAAMLLSRRKVARLRCGGCEEVLQLTAPAGVAGSAPHRTTPTLSALPDCEEPGSCNGSVWGGGGGGALLPPAPQPLHRALGYSSPSPLLQSRRY